LMVTIQDLGIEGPRMRFPGQKESFPVYLQNLPHTATPGVGHNGNPDNPNGIRHNESQDPPFVAPADNNDRAGHSPGPGPNRYGSILRNGGNRPRGESLAAMGRRVDFSLGMKDISSGDLSGDLYEDRDSRDRSRLAALRLTSPSPRNSHETRSRSSRDTERGTTTAVDDFSLKTGRLNRINTDSSAARDRSNHRNRFFGRGRKSEDEAGIMETGMADIPEDGRHTSSSERRLDPRSGLISPAAIRLHTDDSVPHHASGGLPPSSHSHDIDFHMPPRSQTDTFEMRRMH